MLYVQFNTVLFTRGTTAVKVSAGQVIEQDLWDGINPVAKQELVRSGQVGPNPPVKRRVSLSPTRYIKESAPARGAALEMASTGAGDEEVTGEDDGEGADMGVVTAASPEPTPEPAPAPKHAFKEKAKNQPRENTDAALERMIAEEEGDSE